MKVRLPHLPLFVDEIERLNHFIDVLNALDRHFARPQGARVYAAWRSTLNDRDTSYLLGRNVFVHASVPKGILSGVRAGLCPSRPYAHGTVCPIEPNSGIVDMA